MRCCFVNPSLRPGASRRLLPVGLGYILLALQRVGIEFDLIDMDVDALTMEDFRDRLKDKNYDVIGIGCIVTGFRYVRQLAQIVKEVLPKALVVAGNSVATSIPEIILRHSPVDIAVLGEGDQTIVELIQALEKKRDLAEVPGIAFLRHGKMIQTKKRPVIASLDTIGFPDWSLFNLEKYKTFSQFNTNSQKANVTPFPLNAARGCPFSCTFCYHVFKGEKYRRYSAELITGELRRLHERFGATYVNFWDELTFPDIPSVEAMLAIFSSLDFKIAWDAPSRAGLFKKKDLGLIKALAASGCDNIGYSLENASPEILKAMNKHIRVEDFIEQSLVLHEGGVTPLTSVVLGYPQETPETIQATLDVCKECGIFPSVGFLLPLPGTPIYDWAREHGKITDELAYVERIGDRQDLHVNLTSMTDEVFVKTVEEKLQTLAVHLGLSLTSVLKTTTYKKTSSSTEEK